MPERGGPTTQSGIFYQNSVTALYLGRLCDPISRPASQRVILVRVEAPDQVDDTVVTFADEHKVYIQSKENIVGGNTAWQKLWEDFDQQFRNETFQRNQDKLLLQIGVWREEHDQLRELCDRAKTSINYSEWQERLTQNQLLILDKVRFVLSPELLTEKNLLDFFKHVDIEIWTLRYIERDLVPHWMPQSNRSSHELFRLLRDRIGGHARVRGSFAAHDLREALLAESQDLKFVLPPDIEELRKALRNCGALLRQHKHTIADTGYHIRRTTVDDIVHWLEESNGKKNVSMLVDQAGMGKTVVLHDVLCELEDKGIDVLAIKADQQLSNASTLLEIQSALNLQLPVEEIVERLAKLGRVAILVDQIDALSLSLGQDQKTLNITLDFIARLRLIPNTRIVLSCRLFDRNSDYRLKRIEIAQQFTLSELTAENIREVLVNLDIAYDSLSKPTRKLLQIPLHLDLFVLAAENEVTLQNLYNITSWQGLYDLIWQNVVLKEEVNAPAYHYRVKVLNVITDYMDREQKTSFPRTLFQRADTEGLEQAVKWLASIGILTPGSVEWTFLHQTFFDYCYARQFVDRRGDIVETILSSDQGLFERRKLVQVMSHLRGHHPNQYLRDVQRFMKTPQLRFYLYDLLIRWFGSLPNPTDNEWLLAQRLLLDPEKQPQLLIAMHGNIGWFNRLYNALLPDWLSQNGEFVDKQVIPYLISLVDIRQTQVIELIKPYFGQSSEWDSRLENIISRIQNWRSKEAIDLFEQIIYRLPSLGQGGLYQLGIVATIHPTTGCRLIRFVLDKAVNGYEEKRDSEIKELGEDYAYSSSSTSLSQQFQLLEGHNIEKALNVVSQAEPKLFVETMIPWLEQVLALRGVPDENQPDYYMWDELSHNWYENVFRVRYAFIHSLIAALIALAKSETDYFRVIAARLAELPYETPQLLLTHVYRVVPEAYANDAYSFLLTDQRRLDLGDHEQYDSRQLIEAIYPYLTNEQRLAIEQNILAYAPIYKSFGVEALRLRGIEQYRLLQTIPSAYLSPIGVRRLRELKHKFPDLRVSEIPITTIGGVIGSPIPEDVAKKMSDRDWLRAIQKYQKGVEHKDFLKGGAHQLSGVLTSLVKDNPICFFHLLKHVPDNVEDAYATAFINGLAESDAPVEWFWNVVRRFSAQAGRNIKRPIAWALQKRLEDGISEDILHLLDSYVHESQGEDEVWWSKGDNHGDVYSSYLNSDRGSAFRALMRIYDQQRDDTSLERKWSLIKFASVDDSTALRIGAIHELTYMIRYDRDRAISLFEQLIDGHEILLETQYTREFLYRAFVKNFLRVQPYIEAMMNHKLENVQEQGAQLACIAALSPKAMESVMAQEAAQELAKKTLNGSLAWQRGAARIYSHNITGKSMSECKEKVIMLLTVDDQQVQQYIRGIFYSLRGNHILVLRDFIEAYVNAGRGLEHQFTKYLWKYGLLDSTWTLSIIQSILYHFLQQNSQPWQSGIDELIRLVLQIYNDPISDPAMKQTAMDIFDLLMERYSGFAQKVLYEFDQR